MENNYDVKARDEVARDQDSDDEESKEIIDEYDKIEIFVIDASKDGSTVGVDTDTLTTRDNIDGQADNPISQGNQALINELKNFSNIPLSPHVISTDQCEAPSPVIVSSTPDSDIYAPIQRSIDQDASRYTTPQMSLPFPYVSELKERVGHMITIGSSPQSNERKSRGTFSPMPRRSIPKRPCL